MLSWRSPGHPQRGGAEALTLETLRRLAADGHAVTWFSAMWPGAAPVEQVDGIRVVRAGRQWTVHLRAWWWARRRLDEFDVIVDQVNTIPFFTPFWVPKAKRRLYIFQTAREFWWRQTPGLFKLIAPIGYLAEPLYLRVYRTTPAITISQSTKDELVGLGLPAPEVEIIPMANTFERIPTLPEKDGPFRAIIVGRLEPAKNVEESLAAFAALQRRVPDAALDIVGAGADEYRQLLEREVGTLGLTGVTFHGRVDEDTKLRLMAAAHVHIFCSHREGWGLTVTEAAAVGTPSVGYDVPGVRDSIAEPSSLAPKADTAKLGAILCELASDPDRLASLRERAWERTNGMSYEATTDAFLEALHV